VVPLRSWDGQIAERFGRRLVLFGLSRMESNTFLRE
jgi:hypothetical protein